MAYVVSCNWYSLTVDPVDTETEGQEKTVEPVEPSADAVGPGETVDPDFREVSEMIKDGQQETDQKTEEKSRSEESETSETETIDYSETLEYISVQLGVIDVVLVLFLLISVIRQFVRVPR